MVYDMEDSAEISFRNLLKEEIKIYLGIVVYLSIANILILTIIRNRVNLSEVFDQWVYYLSLLLIYIFSLSIIYPLHTLITDFEKVRKEPRFYQKIFVTICLICALFVPIVSIPYAGSLWYNFLLISIGYIIFATGFYIFFLIVIHFTNSTVTPNK